MTAVIYIGIDDTDIPGSPGTGKVARDVAAGLETLGWATSLGVTRHQLLVDPRVRYTSHNSCKGLAVESDRSPEELAEPCARIMAEMFRPGSDPGLCLCRESSLTPALLEFGRRAVTEVLTKEEARTLGDSLGLVLRELGGDGGGIIGALAAVGLRGSRNDGRLVDLPGTRDIRGVLTLEDLRRRTPIVDATTGDGVSIGSDALIDSLDWIRPTLVDGRPILRVVFGREENGRTIWIPAERAMKLKKGALQ